VPGNDDAEMVTRFALLPGDDGVVASALPASR